MALLNEIYLTAADLVNQFGKPAALVLILVGYLVKERFAHQLATQTKELEFVKAQLRNSFDLGVTSHMAEVTFEKHVQFSEKYYRTVFSGLETLLRNQPKEDLYQPWGELVEIRKEYALWITSTLDKLLREYETRVLGVIVGMRALAERTNMTPEGVNKLSFKVNDELSSVCGLPSTAGSKDDNEVTCKKILEELQNLLGVEKLVWCKLSSFIKSF